MARRVVITGAGVVCSIGDSFAQFVSSIRDCRPGVTWVSGGLGPECVTDWALARVPDSSRDVSERPYHDPVTRLAFRAAKEALAQSGWEEERSLLTAAGVYIGSAFGGVETLEWSWIRKYEGGAQSDAFAILHAQPNAAAARISSAYHVLGPSVTYSSGSTASSQAIGEAFIAVREGRLDRALAGGAEACLTPGVLWTWLGLSELNPGDPKHPAASCRPFSRDRAGLVLGEGAAMFTLESLESAHKRGAPILCEVLGFASTTAAGVLGFPDDRSLAAAMQAALTDAHLSPCDIDYIAAHGTGSRAGDLAEAVAIEQLFGDCAGRLLVSSTKALHGHLVGASGALGLASALLALREGFVPATCNLRERDELLGDLDFVPNTPRQAPLVRRVLCNSFSFGAGNAVLVLGRSEIAPAAKLRAALTALSSDEETGGTCVCSPR